MGRKLKLGILVGIVVLSLSGCMAVYTGSVKPAGFFTGVWHGWIAPLALIVSIFDRNVTIYDPNNVGFWYNFGFYIAIISGFGGLSFFRKKK